MNGQFLASLGSKGKEPLEFEYPASILVHPKGQVLVSEGSSGRIQVLNRNLTFSHSFTTHGPPRGEGQGHFGMAVDSQGVVYITDPRDCCIQKFSISGQFIGQFGRRGVGEGKLCGPDGIAIDDKDYIHIGEPALKRISIFTRAGRFVCCFQVCQEDQESATEFNKSTPSLAGLAFDKYGNLYACMPRQGQVAIL